MNQATTTQPSAEISCEQCRELLSDYVDRELSEDERHAVEQHLNGCAKCGTESVRLQGLKKLVQHWDGIKGSGEFRQNVVQQMIRESQQFPTPKMTGNEAGGTAPNGAENGVRSEEIERRGLPPIWILLVAAALAVAVYYLMLFIRGVH